MPTSGNPHTSPRRATAAPGEVVLEARDLVKTFTTGRGGMSRTRVSGVDGLSLSLRAGETLGLVGESGCGKSTLARMLVGLETPDSGSIIYRGRDVANARRADRRLLRQGVQMVFQDPYTSLDPRMTVLEVIGEPLAATGSAKRDAMRDRVAELLSMVGLAPDLMKRYPHQFSGGQRQRIGIARALALEPEVLVCDEPVSALDVSVQAQVINLLRDLQRRLGVALLFIAHDLSVVRHIADRVAVMYLGRLTEIGLPTTVYETPAHPYTQALLSASPVVDRSRRGRLAARIVLDGDPPSPTAPPPGCRFHTRCRMAQEVCGTEIPTLRALSDDPGTDRLAACHRAEHAVTRLSDVFGPSAGEAEGRPTAAEGPPDADAVDPPAPVDAHRSPEPRESGAE